jgi:hypothetical protein
LGGQFHTPHTRHSCGTSGDDTPDSRKDRSRPLLLPLLLLPLLLLPLLLLPLLLLPLLLLRGREGESEPV